LSLTEDEVEKLLANATKLMEEFPVEMARAKIRDKLKVDSPIVDDKMNIKFFYFNELEPGAVYYSPSYVSDSFHSLINDI